MNDSDSPSAPQKKPAPAKSNNEPPSSPAPAATGGQRLWHWARGLIAMRTVSLRDDLEVALESENNGGTADFTQSERTILKNVLDLAEKRVEDVMIPRADVEALEINTKLGDLMVVFEQSGHSRMPVYSETLDDPRGMIHIRDVLAHITKVARTRKGRATKKPAAVTIDFANVDLSKTIGDLNLIRTVLFVPPSMLASDLMARMQATRTQMALVIDEYGGTDGLVSLEDIVEMVVGDIEDEHDEEEPMITQSGDGVFVVDGKAEIDDVAKLIGEDFTAGEHGDYVDTIGGMIFNTLGRVPARGEVVQAIPGFEFHVLDADPRRVKRVRIVETQKGERRRRAVRAEQA